MAIVDGRAGAQAGAVAGDRLRLAGRQGRRRHGRRREVVVSGSAKFLAEHGIDVAEPRSVGGGRSAQKAATVIFVGVGGKLAGFVGDRGPHQGDHAPGAASASRPRAVRVVMLTGDGKTTAEAVGRELGIDEVVADVLPGGQGRGGAAPASPKGASSRWPATASTTRRRWRQADVGIAMGTGTDVAMESSGITLLKGDLMGIVRARTLSHATMRNIRQNLFLSFAYNVAGIPLAAGRALPVLRPAAVARGGGRRDGAVVGQRHRQRAAPAHSEGGLTWTCRRAAEQPNGSSWRAGSGTLDWGCFSSSCVQRCCRKTFDTLERTCRRSEPSPRTWMTG